MQSCPEMALFWLAVVFLFHLPKAPGTSLESGTVSREKRFMPYIYPGGSVIQFAMGLALPADVKGRTVATNSGILININLPTNLSQLRPPDRAVRSTGGHHAITAHLAALLGLRSGAEVESCRAELLCYRHKFALRTGLLPETLSALLESVLAFKDMEYGNTSSTPFPCVALRSCESPYTELIRNVDHQYDMEIKL